MSNTTKINVYLKNPNGWPLTNTCFGTKPVRTGFLENDVALVEDKELVWQTDDQGYAQIELLPLPFPYIMTYSNDSEEVPGYFVFYVPETTNVVEFKDLVTSTSPPIPPNYGDEILAQIVAAKAEVTALVQQANAAADAAQGSATASSNSAAQSEASAQSVAGARDQVAATQLALQAVLDSIMVTVVKIQAIDMQNHLLLGGYSLWVDSHGKLRIMNGVPVNEDTDGVVVGTQTA